MKDWGKELYKEWVKKKFIPQILQLVREKTGYEGKFNLEFKPSWYFIFSEKHADIRYNRETKEIIEHKIIVEEPRLYSNSPWDVFFYGWTLIGEALHITDAFQSGIDNLSSERRIHIHALILINKYMRDNYPSWYRKNKRILERIKKTIIFMKVD